MKKIYILIYILAGISPLSAQTSSREVHLYCYYTQVLPVGHDFSIQKDFPVRNAEITVLRDSLYIQVFRADHNGYMMLETGDNDAFYVSDIYGNQSMIYSGSMISDSLVILIYTRSARPDENSYIQAWLRRRNQENIPVHHRVLLVTECFSGNPRTEYRFGPKAALVLPQQVISQRSFLHYLSTTQF